MLTVACASGKGGTGKTTVATNLAMEMARESKSKIQLLDCDVENPNSHLFLKMDPVVREEVEVLIPQINEPHCSRCGRCVQACNFSALSLLGEHLLVFPELCHSCGLCSYICPERAISEVGRAVGFIRRGTAGTLDFVGGELNPGEAIAVPVIDAVRKRASNDALVIIDAPPGTSCPTVASVQTADFCLLVTEPTPFGLSDLEMAVGMCDKLQVPVGVIINRCDLGDGKVEQYCHSRKLPILAQFPWDRKLASTYAQGGLISEVSRSWSERFLKIGRMLKTAAGRGRG